jgi:predicted nicotinamide N-methyase
VDSGYASEDDDSERDDDSDGEDSLAILRANTYERDFAVRWLTAVIARGEELLIEDDETRTRIVDEAAFILASFTESEHANHDESLTREFSFSTASGQSVQVQLNDAPLSGTDHTDVGLQSWGASIIMSEFMCAAPKLFSLDSIQPGSTIVELGAGTGLVGLTLAKLLPLVLDVTPTVVATDYHPAVLDNLRANITTNFAAGAPAPIQTSLLDWSAPVWSPPLDKPTSMLVAADVVYAPEHARWLRDCAGQILSDDGVFWLMVTVREHGKFEGIPETVESGFAQEDDLPRRGGRVLKIIEKQWCEKKSGVGRGDEKGYNLYRIGWVKI